MAGTLETRGVAGMRAGSVERAEYRDGGEAAGAGGRILRRSGAAGTKTDDLQSQIGAGRGGMSRKTK